MDSKKIRALFTIIESKSITAAAEKLGYTQPGLTNMMNSLEAELGIDLLIRSKSGARLSPAGTELLPWLEAFAAADDELLLQAGRLAEKNRSSLRLGAYASVSKAWLPSILSSFRESSGKLDGSISAADITVGDIKGLYAGVHENRLDCAIVSYQSDLIRDLVWVPLHSDELVAVLPGEENPVSSVFPVALFDGKEFLMPSLGFDMDILPALSADGHVPKAIFRYTNLEDSAIVSMVAHGLGYSVLSELVMQSITDNVRVLKLSPPAFREIGIILSAEHAQDPLIEKFIACSKASVGRLYV